MKRSLTILPVFCLLLLVSAAVKAQDPHFSQFFNAPLALNPSATGLFDADYRVSAIYRNQWASVSTPYVTIGAAAEGNILAGLSEDDFVGVGLFILNDKAGDSEFSSTGINFSAAYFKSLNYDIDNYLTAGIQVGMTQRDINFGNLFFDSQYDGDILNPNLPSNEVFERQQFWFLTVGAGLGWYIIPAERTSVYVGASAYNLNEPNISFMGTEEKLYRKFLLHGSGEFPVGEIISILPRAVFLKQGPATELTLGALGRATIGETAMFEEGKVALSAGALIRLNDAIIPVLRFDYGPLAITASYDLNTSLLSNASNMQGGPEVSLMYTSSINPDERKFRGKGMGCPQF